MTISSRVAAGFGCLILVVATYAPQLAAPLELQDDHRLAAAAMDLESDHSQLGSIAGWLGAFWDLVVDDGPQKGRFRPGSQFFELGLPVLFRDSALQFHVFLLALAGLTTVLLFIAGLRLFDSTAASATLALVAMLAPDPGPASSWFRLGPKEAEGVALVAASVLLMVRAARRGSRRAEVGAWSCAALAALTKESFAVLLPGLVALRVWIEMNECRVSLRESVARLRWPVAAYGATLLVTLVGVVWALASGGPESYGGSTLHSSLGAVLSSIARDLRRTPSLGAWFLPVLLSVVVAARGGSFRNWLLQAASVSWIPVLWIAPQYLLHAGRGGMWDHYWLPCVLGLAALNAAAVKSLQVSRGSLAAIGKVVAAFALSVWTVNAVRIDATAAMNYATRAQVQQQALDELASALPAGSRPVLVSSGFAQSELALAATVFLERRGGHPGRAWIYESTDEWLAKGRNAEYSFADRIDVRTVPPPLPGGVLFLAWPAPGDTIWNSWYRQAGFRTVEASGPQRFLSLKRMGYVEEPYKLRVGVRKMGSQG